MKIIDSALVYSVSAKTQTNVRLRMNYNLHAEMNDPVQRMVNALEPGTYLRPHKHSNPPKWELFFILKGRLAVFQFNKQGGIISKTVLNAAEGTYGVELEANVWHTVVSLEPGTIILECKEGPYQPLSENDFASWSPKEEDPAKEKYIESLLSDLA